jgi:predicted transcriptional regulator
MARLNGTPNRYTLERLDKRLDNIETWLAAEKIQDAGDAVEAIEWLTEGIASGHLDAIAGREHIEKLKHFVESQARSNFSLFAQSRMGKVL